MKPLNHPDDPNGSIELDDLGVGHGFSNGNGDGYGSWAGGCPITNEHNIIISTGKGDGIMAYRHYYIQGDESTEYEIPNE